VQHLMFFLDWSLIDLGIKRFLRFQFLKHFIICLSRFWNISVFYHKNLITKLSYCTKRRQKVSYLIHQKFIFNYFCTRTGTFKVLSLWYTLSNASSIAQSNIAYHFFISFLEASSFRVLFFTCPKMFTSHFHFRK